MKIKTVKENLDIARKKAHEVMRKNGHFKRMTKLSIIARKKKKLSTVKK